MCGITGFWTSGRDHTGEMSWITHAMTATLHHRGPDDHGSWVDETAGLALGHTRLSIVDLSASGHQPMMSASGRYVITFNGEVYNHRMLRRELTATGRAPGFRGHSDTEVMLAAIEAWGIDAAVEQFVGMFAFALWDRETRSLHLVRDRLGIKPLYYGWSGRTLLFASELKAFRVHPGFQAEVDRDAVAFLMQRGCVPAPHSIYRGVFKLLPGTILTFEAPDGRDPSARVYWSAHEVAARGVAKPFTGSDREAVDHLDTLLRDAVALRMVADVPLGAFLSGGVDSSTVVALMQAQSGRPVRTFSIGFADLEHDEAGQARAVANHLHTDHTELYVSPADALAVIPRLPELYDEPFADSSQIPTFLVSAVARRYVTVALSGDGGDELFAGYNRHVWATRLWRATQWMPESVRTVSSRALAAVGTDAWERLVHRIRPLVPRALGDRTPGAKLQKLVRAFSASSADGIYDSLASQWDVPNSLVLGATAPAALPTDGAYHPTFAHPFERMLYLDLVTYLPDDILTKLDRASMAVSLEARVPLLDHRVVEFAWHLPRSMRVRAGRSKWILRQVLDRYVPRALIDRPKWGFAVPLDAWLRGPLRPWAEELLDPRILRDDGFLDAEVVRSHWTAHLSGRRNLGEQIWNVLMFQAWLDGQRNEQSRRRSDRGPVFAGVVA